MAREVKGVGCPEMDEDFVRTATCERCLDGIKDGQQHIADMLERFIEAHDKAENRRSFKLIGIVTILVALVSNLDKIGQVIIKLAAK